MMLTWIRFCLQLPGYESVVDPPHARQECPTITASKRLQELEGANLVGSSDTVTRFQHMQALISTSRSQSAAVLVGYGVSMRQDRICGRLA